MFKKKSSLNSYYFLLRCAVYCFLLFAGPSIPFVSAEDITTNEQAIDTIQKNQSLIQSQIQHIQAALEPHKVSSHENTFTEEQLDILRKIDFIYTQQLSDLKNSVELDRKIEKLQLELTGDAASAENSKPVLFIEFNKMLEDKILLQGNEQSISSSIRAAEALLRDAKENQSVCEKNRRSIKDSLPPQENNATDSSLVRAELLCRLAAEEVSQNELTLQNTKKELRLNQLMLASVEQKITETRPRVVFSDEQLRDQILEIDKNIRELTDMLDRAQAKKQLQYERWAKAKEELDTNLLSPRERPKKEQEVQTWKVLSDTRRLEVDVLNNRLKRLADLKKVWQNRYLVFHNTGTSSLKMLLESSGRTLKSLKREKQLQVAHQSNVSNNALLLEQKLKTARESSDATWFIETQRTAFQNQMKLLDHDLKSIQALQWDYKKLQSEIEERLQYRSFNERFLELQEISRNAWNYELTSSDDFPITVGKIITALFLLIAGYFISHYLTAKAGKQIKARFNLDQAAVSTIQTIACVIR